MVSEGQAGRRLIRALCGVEGGVIHYSHLWLRGVAGSSIGSVVGGLGNFCRAGSSCLWHWRIWLTAGFAIVAREVSGPLSLRELCTSLVQIVRIFFSGVEGQLLCLCGSHLGCVEKSLEERYRVGEPVHPTRMVVGL